LFFRLTFYCLLSVWSLIGWHLFRLRLMVCVWIVGFVVTKTSSTFTQKLLRFATINVSLATETISRMWKPFVFPSVVITMIVVLGGFISPSASTGTPSLGACFCFTFIGMTLAAWTI